MNKVCTRCGGEGHSARYCGWTKSGITFAAGLLLCVSVNARDAAVVREFKKLNPCPSTGKTYGPCPGWIADHRYPICAGGEDSVENLRWQTKEESYAKDVEERRICAQLKKWREK